MGASWWLCAALALCGLAVTEGAKELLNDPGFESLLTRGWDCWAPVHCAITHDAHSGSKAYQASGRQDTWQGPSHYFHAVPGHTYHVSAYMKLHTDHGKGQSVKVTADFHYTDGTEDYIGIASRGNTRTSTGWVHLQGNIRVPSKSLRSARVYFEGPEAGVEFIIDDASVTEVGGQSSDRQRQDADIDRLRKSNINVQVTSSGHVNKGDVQIQLRQTKKSFPFGTAVNAGRYNSDSANGKYRAFIHNHFNWAVPENALKWYAIERSQGQKNYQPGLDMVNGLRSNGIKVRGHNLIWSVDQYVQDWIKKLSGDTLRNTVNAHIRDTMAHFKGKLEHWDVNNENLHGHWFEHALHDNNFNTEVFKYAHGQDGGVKLFLNDYNVVAWGEKTNAYLQQAKQLKAANAGLYGMGVQCHFGENQDPDYSAIKGRLDTLAQAGLPIWATELDVMSSDENKRADYIEHALRVLYSHEAVEGILLWGFWDQSHWRGEKAALVKGNNLDLTAAGRRFLDLLENQWMTDVTRTLSQAGDHFTVRGYHGDYELAVRYQGKLLSALSQNFTLGTHDKTLKVNVHV